jgi:hypothetical protein
MQRVFAVIAILVALVSLVVPSAVVGARGFAAHPSPTYVLTAQGQYVSGPCLLKPGKASPCPRPDLGVLAGIGEVRRAQPEAVRLLLAEVMPASFLFEPTAPPPRRG